MPSLRIDGLPMINEKSWPLKGWEMGLSRPTRSWAKMGDGLGFLSALPVPRRVFNYSGYCVDPIYIKRSICKLNGSERVVHKWRETENFGWLNGNLTLNLSNCLLIEAMTTKRPVGVSFPKDATQNSTPRGTLPVPSIRSETGRENIGFDQGISWSCWGAQLTTSLPYLCNDSRICVLWERDPHGLFSHT